MTEYGLLLEDISGNVQFQMDVFSEVAQPKVRKVTVYHSSDSHDPKTLEEEIEAVRFGFVGLLQADVVDRERKLHYLLRTDNDIILVYFDRDVATYVSMSRGLPANDPAGSNFDIFSIECTAKGAVLGQVREAVDARCTTGGYTIDDTAAMRDAAIQLFGNVNYLTFTEVDPNTHLAVAEHHLDFDAYMNEDCYLYKDFGTDFFGDFEHKVDVKISNVADDDIGYVWAIANDIDDIKGLIDEGKAYIGMYFEGLPIFEGLRLVEYTGTETFTAGATIAENTWYYLTITKSGTSLTCNIYEDSARTVLNNTISLTLHTDYKFRYLFGANTHNAEVAVFCTLDIENLTIDDSAVYFTQLQNDYMLPDGSYNMIARMKQSADASDNLSKMEVDVSGNPSITQTLTEEYLIYELPFTVDASANGYDLGAIIQFTVTKEDVSGNIVIDYIGFCSVQ